MAIPGWWRKMKMSKRCSLLMSICIILFLAVVMSGCTKAESVDWVTTERADHKILVRWAAVDGAESYRLFRKVSEEQYAYVCDLSETIYEDTEITKDNSYSYKVKAVINGVLSDGVESEPVKSESMPEILSVNSFHENEIEVR
jgi:fibronectin type 3 domain-containing protein